MNRTQRQAWLDQEDARVSGTIRKHGWAVELIGFGVCSTPGCDCKPSEVPFAYTIGLFGMGHPELLILGAGMSTSHNVLNDLGKRIRAGEDLIPGQLITFKGWQHRIIPEEVPNPGDIVFGANRHYQRPRDASVPVLQLSYDDLQGRFPWEPGYAAPKMQPRPGTFHV
ncbi:MAG: DUF4262 domain-containing protein [Nocardiaceae bacterium]|nr:DUF4262 domain-containing protein [Nocardiaceae bacterium]